MKLHLTYYLRIKAGIKIRGEKQIVYCLSSFPLHTVKISFPPLEQPRALYYTSTRGQLNFLFRFAQA